MAWHLHRERTKASEMKLFTCRWQFTNVSFEKDYLGVTKRSYEEELSDLWKGCERGQPGKRHL